MALPLSRYEEIASVLVKYGFESFIGDILPGSVRWRLSKQDPRVAQLSVYRRMRLAIQELGPTFVKFGQIMSTRREILPPELVSELRLLHDKVEPIPWEKVKPIIEQRCGPVEETFLYLNQRPFAAASLSQAHHAKLKDGTVIVLKVQRPGIRSRIETDIRILDAVAKRLEKSNPNLSAYNIHGMVHEFTRQILAELDFVRDGKNAEQIARGMKDVRGVKVPRIYWRYTSSNLLAMEYIRGVRLDQVDKIRAMGVDPTSIARLGFRAYLKQIFEDGFFHGDPHPGNLLVTPRGELAFLDFGLVGFLRPEKRDLLLKMLMAIVDKDVDELVEVFRAVGIRVRDAWADDFKDDLYLALLESDQYNPEIQTPGPVDGVSQALRKYHIRVPMVTMLMLKTLVMVEADSSALDPRFDFVNEVKPMMAELLKARILAQLNVKKTALNLIDAFTGVTDLPNSLNDALKVIGSGSFRFKLAHDDLDRLGRSIDRASYTVLLGLIMSSLVLGGGIVLFATKDVWGPQAFTVGVLYFLFMVAVGLISIFVILRSR